MAKNLSRNQVIARLERIRNTVKSDIDHLLADLREDEPGDGKRTVRDYDMPTPLAEEIADRWGVDLAPDPDDEIPEWVLTRYGHLMKHPENE